MVTKNDVIQAMNMIVSPSLYLSATAVQKQLASSLEVYVDRGEYDPEPTTGMSYRQAKECLELAGYEIQEVA